MKPPHALLHSHRAPRAVAAAAALAALAAPALTAPALAAPAAPASATGTTDGEDWTVTTVPGGYEVTLELDAPVEVRASLPSLTVDGEEIGAATESLDGTTLTVLTTDPSVLEASSVEAGWVGEVPDGEAPSALPAELVDLAEGTMTELDADPSEVGPYAVERYDYDLGDEYFELRTFDRLGEARAAVFMPDASATGELPVVLFLHGRHTACSGGTRNPLAWPCNDDQTDIPSYLGYNEAAEVLASQGYAVVSISANAINSLDGSLADDTGAAARGQLVLDHLELLREANAGSAPEGISESLTGRLDLSNVGLMGHSRGGEGIMRAAVMNAELEEPFGINGVLPLAPTDYTRITVPGIPTAVILPYCDGDVEDQMGQKFINDSRYAYDDDVLRSSVLVMGMNHNFFNTYWTPGLYDIATSDDWRFMDRQQTSPICGENAETRVDAATQYSFGTAYMAGFFRLTLGGDEEFLPMFDGSDAVPASAGDVVVDVSATQPASTRLDLATFATTTDRVQVSGAGTFAFCENLSPVDVPSSKPYCVETLNFAQAPDWSTLGGNGKAGSVPSTPALHFTYEEPGSREVAAELAVTLTGGTDLSDYESLSFRVSPDEFVVGSTELDVELLDGAGGSAEVSAEEFGAALEVLPGLEYPLRKVLLQQLTIPLTEFEGVDLTDVRQVRFNAPQESGGVLLSDLAALAPATVGTPEISARPLVTVPEVRVEEGSGVGSVEVPLVLSAPAEETSEAYLTVLGSATGSVGNLMEKVTFAPGEQCVAVEVPLVGNTTTSSATTATFVTNASNTQTGVTIGDSFGAIIVREDDAVVSGEEELTLADPVGVQGDACAEAMATTGELTAHPATTTPGSPVTVTASGFRTGEAVTITLDGVEVATVVSADGSVEAEVILAEDASYGAHALLATGAGSGYSAAGEVTVGSPFVDVSVENMFFTEIAWLAEQGISTGWSTPQGQEYRPLQPIARDAMAAFLYRMAEVEDYTPPTTSPFADVATSNQFYTEIAWLAEQGISTGWSTPQGQEYRPLQPIARDAMAAFLYRMAEVEDYTPPTTSPFADVATGNQFYTEIAWMQTTGISTGWEGNNGTSLYRPLTDVARDAMAAFLYRYDHLED
ncbi:S-layer homology domain-containing protein [Serinibacter salmoneus]|uniref:S-layer family protein n=1 Tax=Serinibacter salmoneus TaxID=556530 RepID=A0A2A9D0Z9_9MICO|nr:S-layer homology domain-containing protein [Serinibacter salmoneus]PFG20056.1 S-layer family protein [Serinibacter salmoneus]